MSDPKIVLGKFAKGFAYGVAALVVTSLISLLSDPSFITLFQGHPYLLLLIPTVKGLLDALSNWLKHRGDA